MVGPHDPWEMLYDQEGEFASLRLLPGNFQWVQLIWATTSFLS